MSWMILFASYMVPPLLLLAFSMASRLMAEGEERPAHVGALRPRPIRGRRVAAGKGDAWKGDNHHDNGTASR